MPNAAAIFSPISFPENTNTAVFATLEINSIGPPNKAPPAIRTADDNASPVSDQ